MREDSLETLFALYQRSGDTRALAEVFDRTAVDLLRLARYLAHDRGDAEDLLQDTWLIAIERALCYDAQRPLRPWLVGILARRAARARQKTQRMTTAADLEVTDDLDPQRVVADSEIQSTLAAAVGELPPMYREVLLPRLQEDARSQDIARTVGRSPGLVRMQITRGLRLLRRALPAGALSAAFLLTRGKALAAVRAKTLHAAAAHPHLLASTGPALAGSGTTLLGGLLMFKKLALFAIALGALIITYVCLDADRPEDARSVPISQVAAAIEREPAPQVAPPERAPAATSVATLAEPPSDGLPASYRQHLSGIRGRLLESDGAPLVHTDVTLIEFNPSDLIGQMSKLLAEPMPPPRVFGAESRTDAEGRFLLNGAHPRAAHGLGIDLGGPRAAVRVLCDGLDSGQTLDVGDIVLDPVIALIGRVVDDRGDPVADARVRAAAMPIPPQLVGLEHLRDDSFVMIHDRGILDATPIPAWARQILDRLPIPTTRTSADGTFRLTGVPTGMVTAIVDHDRYIAAVKGPMPSGKGGARDVGDILLGDGVTAVGQVVDADGEPVGGVPVLVATIPELDVVAFARTTTTDAEGRFEVPHMPEFRRTRFASRGQPFERWTFLDADDPDEEIELALPAGDDLVIDVSDPSGEPIVGADIRVAPRSPTHELADFFRPWPEARATPVEQVPGQYRIGPLSGGDYVIAACAEGYLVTRERVRDRSALRLVLHPGRPRQIRVVSGQDRAPVEHAQVSIVHADSPKMALEGSRTDAEGRARLALVPDDAASILRVRHPGYAALTVKIPDVGEGDPPEFEVVLDKGGDLLGQLDAGGFAPPERYLFLLTAARRTLDVDEFPQITVTDARGGFRLGDLAPGEYYYEVAQNPLWNDPLRKSIADLDDLNTLCRGSCTIVDGQTTQLSVPFFAPGMPNACTLYGVVRRDGEPVRATVSTYQQRYIRTECDDEGRFRMQDLAPGTALIQFTTGLAILGDGVSFSTEVVLQPGEIRELVLDLTTITVDLQIVDAAGEEITGDHFVRVRRVDDAAAPFAMNTQVNRTQRPLEVPSAGRYQASISDLHLGRASVEFDVPRTGPVVLQLPPTTPCAGHFSLPPQTQDSFLLVSISYGEGKDTFSTSIVDQTRGGQVPFSYGGLPPGPVEFEFRLANKTGHARIVLPEGGASDLAVTPTFDP